jgi:hypothetical protein
MRTTAAACAGARCGVRAKLGRDGIVLIPVLLLLALMLAIGAYAARNVQIELLIAKNEVDATQALAVAMAGINEAIEQVEGNFGDKDFDDELSNGGTGGALANVGSAATLDDATYRFREFGGDSGEGYYVRMIDNYDDVPNDSTDDTDQRVAFQSVGLVGGAERTVEVGVRPSAIFDHGVFGDTWVSLASNVYTDSYDSEVSNYGGFASGTGIDMNDTCQTSYSGWSASQNGDIGTNSVSTTDPYAIEIASNANVYGDAFVGEGGDAAAAVSNAGTIHGSPDTLDDPVDMSFVDPPSPSSPTVEADINIGNNTVVELTYSTGHYSFDTIENNGNNNSLLTFNISGDVVFFVETFNLISSNSSIIFNVAANSTFTLVVDTVTMTSNNTLALSGDGSMEIFVTDRWDGSSNSSINNLTQDPTRFAIYGGEGVTGADMNVASNTTFFGTIYAPNADLTIDSNMPIFGAVAGATVTLDSNACVHYDEALGRNADKCCRILYWHEVRGD